jgi:hypothetical protein
VFGARPADAAAACSELSLVRAVRRAFTGPSDFLADPANRARVAEYVADMVSPYQVEFPADAFAEPSSPAVGQSYGEMAEALITSAVAADEPVDLLILAFAVHDLRPGRQTAAYLSHMTPGAPLGFAICDQGAAAAFSGLRIAREYARSAGIGRALLTVVEQAALPYGCRLPLPAEHRGVAMLFGECVAPQARLTCIRQHAGIAPGNAADVAAAGVAELTAGHGEVRLVLGDGLGRIWPAPPARRLRVMPPGQPFTGVWWGLIDELAGAAGDPGLTVVADYDQDLRYLCLACFDASAT